MGVINKDGALYFATGIDNSGLKKDSEEAKRYIQDISDFAKSAGAALGAAFSVGVLKRFGQEVINVRGEMQMLETSFDVLLGGKGVPAFMAELKQFAVDSPLSLSGVSQAAQTLLGFNVEAEKVIPTIKQLGDISMGNEQRFQSLALAFAQMSSTGKLMGQDLLQMINAGFNPLSEISAKTGKSIAELKKEMESGAISSQMVADAFASATAEGGKLYGMTQKQAEGIKGLQAQLEGAWQENFNKLGKDSEGLITDMYKMGISVAENYEKIGRVITSLIATYGAYKAALVVVTMAESGWTIAQMTKYKWLMMIEKAQKLLNATMLKNPYVAVTVLVVGLVSALIALKDRTSDQEKAQKRVNKVLEEAENRKNALKNKGNELISVLKDETATIYQQVEAYKKLLELLPEDLKGMTFADVQKMSTGELNKILNQKSEADYKSDIEKQYTDAHNKALWLGVKIRQLEDSYSKDDDKRIKGLKKELNIANIEAGKLRKQLADISEIEKEATFQSLSKEDQRKQLENQKKVLEEQKALLTGGKSINPFDIDPETAERIKEIDSAISSLNDGINAYNETTTTKNYAYWEKIKDDAENARKTLGTDKKGSNEWDELTKKITQAEAELKKYSTKDQVATQDNQVGDAKRKLLDTIKQNALEEKRLREDLNNEITQAEIDVLNDGFNKTMKQRELNHQIELQNIERQKEDYIAKVIQARKEEFEAEEDIKSKKDKNYVKKSFNESSVTVDTSAYDKIISGKNEQYKNETKKSWNDLALEFGDYYQKRIAIAEKWEKTIAELPVQFQREARNKMNSELAELDGEYSKTTTAITELFKDTSEKSVKELRKMADEAERMKDFVLGGQWNAGNGADFGITEAQFKSLNEEWSKSPEKLEAIVKAIRGLKREADLKENTFKSISDSIEAIFNPDTSGKDKKKAWEDLANGIREVNDMAQAVGDSVSSIFSAFGNDAAAEMAGNITNLIGGVGQTGMGIAQLASGDIIGGIKNLASGIGNVVTSITRMNDAAKEKKIQQLQNQIDALNTSYEALGDAIGKAYSKDASNLIEQQNVLLKQQQLLIKQQIKQEEAKKKTDKNKIKEWQATYDEIDKQISENKVKAVDAIFGEDIQSAIDNFAQAYVNMWAAGDDKAKSRKDFVKSMIKGMILEAMKADIAKPMEAIRKKLEAFWSDDRITDQEADIIDQMVADLQNQLDKRYSWADKYIKDDISSSGVTGELKAAMTEQTGSQLVGLWNMTAMDIRQIKEFFEKNPPVDVAKELNSLLNELQAIRQNTKDTADNTEYLEEGVKKLEEKLEEIRKNTKPNNSRI
ncbi:MAG: tape measure protein [Petrimonas sp.]|nr:tape measure protein [Petrimonas sp.]